MKTRLYRIAETFEGEDFRKLMKNTIFAEKTVTNCSLLPCQGCYTSKFLGRKLHEQPQNSEICKPPFPVWSSSYTYYSRSEVVNPGNEAIHVYIYPLGFVSLIPRPLGTRQRYFHLLTCNHLHVICSFDWRWIMVRAVMMSTVVEHLPKNMWIGAS